MPHVIRKLPALVLALLLTLIASAEASAQANIVIFNGDAAGVGFNDTTPATPIGGNTGTTIGQQRLIAFQAAASIWGATLSSGPTINIRSSWAALPCTANSGTLGQAGAVSNTRDFQGGIAQHWYPTALANALRGADLNPTNPEIDAQFNSNLGNPGCLQTLHWYYGLDNNHGTTGVDLISVLLHEFAHGLGVQTVTNRSTGAQAGDDVNGRFPTIYDEFLFDSTAGKSWPQMTNAERVASAINDGNLVWSGPQAVYDATHGVLSLGTPRLRINSPASIAGNYRIGLADFGPSISPSGITGSVNATVPNDACAPLSTSLAGQIALVDRGTCTFITKAKNAQNAGAIGVIIVNNVADNRPPALGGGPDNTITIPTVSITQANGNTIKSQLTVGVNASVLLDMATFAGADTSGRPLIYAPNPLESGSSVSHWDDIALRNQLMEPNIAGDLDHSVAAPGDLTFSLLKDIGWKRSLAPTILVEPGTSQAAALDSVTHATGPFSNISPNNLSGSGDTRRRIIFFTTDLALNPTDDLSVLKVFANGIQMVIENAGPNSRLAGTSFVIVRLDGLSQGTYALSVNLRGVNSTNAPTIQIIP